MINYIIGGAGSGKSHCLAALIETGISAGGDVIAIVPEQYSYEFDRKMYAVLGAEAFNTMESHSFTSLARRIFQQYGAAQAVDCTDDLTKLALVEKAIRRSHHVRHALNYYRRQCDKGQFIQQMSEVITVLRRGGSTSEQLFQQCESLNGHVQEKLQDISVILQEYEMLLQEHERTDMLTDLTEAAAIANGQDFFEGKTIFLDEFESFTPDQYEMLTVLFSTAKDVHIAIRLEQQEHEEMLTLFSSVGAAQKKLHQIAKNYHLKEQFTHCKGQWRTAHEDLQTISRQVFRPMPDAQPTQQSQHLHLFEARTPVDEAEYICATIRRLLVKDSTLRCRDIAIVSNQLEAYAGLFRHAMERYQLPYHMDEARPISHTPFMVYLLSLCSLLSQKHLQTELLMRCGKTGFTDCSWMDLSLLENYCYMWSIEGDMWEQPFTAGDALEAEAAEAVRQQLVTPVLHLRELFQTCRTGADYSRAVYEFLEQQQIGERAASQIQHPDAGMREQLMQDFKRVWESLMDILDVLAGLYETEEMDGSTYCQLMQNLLKQVKHAIPPRTLDAVFIGSVRTSRLSEPKITFVFGAIEGCFPQQATKNLLFTERDRIALSNQGIEIGEAPELRMADQQLAVYKTLSSASEHLYLTYALTNAEDAPCSRSIVLTQLLQMFANGDEILRTQSAPELSTAYYAVTKPAAYYHYVQDFSKRTSEISTLQALLCEDDIYEKRIQVLQRVHDHENFSLSDTAALKQLIGSSLIFSASQLDTFVKCPFQYFCRYVMHLYERKKKRFQAQESGNMVHYCMEQLLRSVPKEEFLKFSPEQLSERLAAYANMYLEQSFGQSLEKNLRDEAAMLHAVAGMNELAVHMQRELSQTDFYPAYFELQLRDSSRDFPAPIFSTAAGEQVRLHGKIDRVDLCQIDGKQWARVIDYKTGGDTFHLSYLDYGLNMQMLLYLFAITEKGSRLADASPAGVLYLPAGIPGYQSDRTDGKTREEAIDAAYRMNGLVVEDAEVLRSMEKNAAGIYLNSKLKNDGTFHKNSGIYLPEHCWKTVKKLVSGKVIQTAEDLYAGAIEANPLLIGNDVDACKWCGFSTVCGVKGTNHCRRVELDKDANQTVRERIIAETEQEEKEAAKAHGETMDDTAAGSN